MSWLPKEKDRRKGTLSGILNGDKIRAIQKFMQEGMKIPSGLNLNYRDKNLPKSL